MIYVRIRKVGCPVSGNTEGGSDAFLKQSAADEKVGNKEVLIELLRHMRESNPGIGLADAIRDIVISYYEMIAYEKLKDLEKRGVGKVSVKALIAKLKLESWSDQLELFKKFSMPNEYPFPLCADYEFIGEFVAKFETFILCWHDNKIQLRRFA